MMALGSLIVLSVDDEKEGSGQAAFLLIKTCMIEQDLCCI